MFSYKISILNTTIRGNNTVFFPGKKWRINKSGTHFSIIWEKGKISANSALLTDTIENRQLLYYKCGCKHPPWWTTLENTSPVDSLLSGLCIQSVQFRIGYNEKY
jgi:hypothetical protein